MNEIFGYCGARNNEFQKGEHVRIGRNIYQVVLASAKKNLKKGLTGRRKCSIINTESEGMNNG